ncbi:MAG: (Fe-S)-binding protein [Planctomycetaceae bacterium]
MTKRVGLFIPCYIDQLYPQVGMATLALLERHGATVEFPEAQTCCGQPLANVGCFDDAKPVAKRFLDVFKSYDYVVCPSGSCVAMVRCHYEELLHGEPEYAALQSKTFELCEFLTDVLHVSKIPGKFPHKVGLHQSCHGLRELRLASSSEIVGESYGKARELLASMEGAEVTTLTRPDECCGFGGTFSVSEEAVSCMMGLDRINDHLQAGTEVLTSVDMSCLMHLQGLIRRRNIPIQVLHIAEILAGTQVPTSTRN